MNSSPICNRKFADEPDSFIKIDFLREADIIKEIRTASSSNSFIIGRQ